MSIYAKRNPWIASTAGAVPTAFSAIMAAKTHQAQQQYQQRLLELHGKQWEAQANLDDAKRLEIGQKMVQTKSIADLANIVGQSQGLKKSIQSASLGNNPEVLANAATLLRNSNMAPQGGFDISRGDLSDLLLGLGKSSASTIAASTPTSAADLLQPRNISQGGTAFDSFGDLVGVGQQAPTKPIVVKGALVDPDTGKAIYTAPEEPTIKNVPPGDVSGIVDKTTGTFTPTYTNTISKPFNLGNSWGRILDPKYGVDDENTRTNLLSGLAKIGQQQVNEALRKPDTTSSDGAKQKAAQFTAPADTSTLITPKSQEEFDALPSGSMFINPADGQPRRKK